MIASLLLVAGCVAIPPRRIDEPAPARFWQPPLTPRADILAVHGFGDHKATFSGLGEFMASNGIAVHAFDLRGFGESSDFGVWPGLDALLAQLQDRLGTFKTSERPLYVLGDSMGAALLTLAAARGELAKVDGIVLVAPAVWGGATLNGFYRGALGFARRALPWLRLSGRGLPIRASDNIELLRARGRDPLFLKEPLVGMVAGLVELMDEARSAAPELDGRLLVLVGEKDQVVPPAAQLSFARTIGAGDCTLVQYPEGWHLLLHDLQRERVFADIRAWLENAEPPSRGKAQCSALPS